MGIIDNSSGTSAGRVLCTAIVEISVIKIFNQKAIMLEVKNLDQYINRRTNGLKKRMMNLNYKTHKTPITLSSNTLKISFKELLSLISYHLDASRK